MVSSLQNQLAAIAANSSQQLNLKAQKAAHGKSLLFEPRVAVTQDFNSLYRICREGFEELQSLDTRFSVFAANLFSEQSKSEERGLMTAAQNQELGVVIESFLTMVSGRIPLKPAQKAIEWLIRRFRIHEQNTEILILSFLPFHAQPIFASLLSILPQTLPQPCRFLYPSLSTMEPPPFQAILQAMVQSDLLFTSYNNFTIRACRARHHAVSVLSFWASLTTQAISSRMSNAQSGQLSIRREKQENLLLKVLSLLNEALSPQLRDIDELVTAACMMITVLVIKGALDDNVLDTLMEQVALETTPDTLDARLTCLALIAEHRHSRKVPKSIVRRLAAIDNLAQRLEDLSSNVQVGRLVLGLILRELQSRSKKRGHLSITVVNNFVKLGLLTDHQQRSLLEQVSKMFRTSEIDDLSPAQLEMVASLIEIVNESPQLSNRLRATLNKHSISAEVVESKLRMTIAAHDEPAPYVNGNALMLNGSHHQEDEFDKTIEQLSRLRLSAPSFLSSQANRDYVICKAALARSLSSLDQIERLLEIEALHSDGNTLSLPLLTLLLRMTCDTSCSSKTRAAVVRLLTKIVVSQEYYSLLEVQLMVPTMIAVLLEDSIALRQAAADAFTPLVESLEKTPDPNATGSRAFHHDTYEWRALSRSDTKILIDQFILPHLEEAVMDPQNLLSSISSQLGQPNPQMNGTPAHGVEESAGRICAYFTAHAAGSSFAPVVLSALKIVNQIGFQLHTNEHESAALLKQAISSPISLVDDHPKKGLRQLIDEELWRSVICDRREHMKLLHELLSGQIPNARASMVNGGYLRLGAIWASLSNDEHSQYASLLLEASLQKLDILGSQLYQASAATAIQALPLPGTVLLMLVASLPRAIDMPSGGPAVKRRRTSRSQQARLASVDPDSLAETIARYTLVLELVESNEPAQTPELLPSLFQALEHVQHFRLLTESSLTYLQGLVLNTLLSIVERLKVKGRFTAEPASVRIDLIVECIQHSTSAQIQSSALLLIASLASWQPDSVVHSIMPIFTFMGTTILRQGDDYSARVTEKTLSQVIPPLVESFRKKNKDIVVGASTLLLSFTSAFDHIPPERRLALFKHLSQTLGPDDCLYAILAMLIDAHPSDPHARQFLAELLRQFEPSTTLRTIRKCLDLVWDIFRPRRVLSNHVLNLSERSKETYDAVALNLLAALKDLLGDDNVREQLSESFGVGDLDSANAQRSACVELIQESISLNHHLKAKTALSNSVANVLSAIIGLLPTIELVQCGETLLEQDNFEVRQVAIRSVLSRAKETRSARSDDALALIGFAKKLQSLLPSLTDTSLRSLVISCVSIVSKQVGKKDTPSVLSIAQTIASKDGLDHHAIQVQLAALDCIINMIRILREEIVPIIPMILPATFKHLESCVAQKSATATKQTLDLAKSCITLVSTITDSMSFLMTGEYLDSTLQNLARSAMADASTARLVQERSGLQRLLARNVGADELFAALARGHDFVTKLDSTDATISFLSLLRAAISAKSKSVVIRNSPSLFSLFLQLFSYRQIICDGQESTDTHVTRKQNIEQIENVVIDIALVMVMKLNDATLRPFIVKSSEWASQISKRDLRASRFRSTSWFRFMAALFNNFRSLVTSYTTYVVDGASSVLENTSTFGGEERDLLHATLEMLEESFNHDEEQFWQSPHHFNPIASPLTSLLQKSASTSDKSMLDRIRSAIVALASATRSGEQHKAINTALLKLLRHDDSKVRLAAVQVERQLTELVGDEWLSMLPEMLPFVSELMEDDDRDVEKAGKEWVRYLEGVLGENLEL